MSTDAGGTPCRDVPPTEWHDRLAGARAEGFDFFDWLTAVDQTDAGADEAGEDGSSRHGAGEDHANEDHASEDGAGPAGFDVVCHLMATDGLPTTDDHRLRQVLVRTRVAEGAALASVTDLFRGAAWHERETHEMFGIEFAGFEDGTGQGLRPLLLPDGFEGAPLRKSFVLAARASKPWPGAKEPGESDASPRRSRRRRLQPPGVPDPEWGPR